MLENAVFNKMLRKKIVYSLIRIFDLLPANGGPMRLATPWTKSKRPYAFVNLSSVISSTRMMLVRL